MEETWDSQTVTREEPFVRAGEWVQHDPGEWDDPWVAKSSQGSYAREGRINAGGQGEVFRGRAPDGTPVALKYLTLSGNEAQQAEDLARFGREARLQSMLDHPGVMPILGAHLGGAEPHFAMPIAEDSLRDRLAATGQGLPVEDVRSVFGDMLAAVAYAHSRGVIHRDLKPENVLFCNGRPVLSDFGLGRRLYSGSTTLTITNAGMGTVAYSAPEQFTDAKHADVRADVFALGRILYEMLCGGYAFQNMDMRLIPAEFRYAVIKATKFDREERFQTVGEMIMELALPDDDSERGLLSPTDEAKRLIAGISAGDTSQIPHLIRVLVQNADDASLYLDLLPTVPVNVLSAVALQSPDDLLIIMTAFDDHADDSHPFSFTDTLAVFLRDAFDVTADMRVRLIVIERLLVLGYTHNRWFVRDRFVEVVREATRDTSYVSAIAGILRSHPETFAFVRPGFDGVSLPPVIRGVIR